MAKLEWISTKDRLPEEGEYVLINSRTYISDFLETIFAVAYLDNGWWRDSWFDRQIALETDKDITHWAELQQTHCLVINHISQQVINFKKGRKISFHKENIIRFQISVDHSAFMQTGYTMGYNCTKPSNLTAGKLCNILYTPMN